MHLQQFLPVLGIKLKKFWTGNMVIRLESEKEKGSSLFRPRNWWCVFRLNHFLRIALELECRIASRSLTRQHSEPVSELVLTEMLLTQSYGQVRSVLKRGVKMNALG